MRKGTVPGLWVHALGGTSLLIIQLDLTLQSPFSCGSDFMPDLCVCVSVAQSRPFDLLVCPVFAFLVTPRIAFYLWVPKGQLTCVCVCARACVHVCFSLRVSLGKPKGIHQFALAVPLVFGLFSVSFVVGFPNLTQKSIVYPLFH